MTHCAEKEKAILQSLDDPDDNDAEMTYVMCVFSLFVLLISRSTVPERAHFSFTSCLHSSSCIAYPRTLDCVHLLLQPFNHRHLYNRLKFIENTRSQTEEVVGW